MRAFWAIVALLVVGAGWLVFAKPSSGDGAPRPSSAGASSAATVQAPAALPGAASEADTKKAAQREATPPVTARVDPDPPQAQPEPTPTSAPVSAPTSAPTAASETAAATPTATAPAKPAPTETAAAPEAPTTDAAVTETAAKDAEAKVEEAKTAETKAAETKTAEAPAPEAKPAAEAQATEAKTTQAAAVPEVATPAAAPGPTGGTPAPASAPASTTEGAVPAVETGPIPAKFETLDNGDTKVDGRFTVKGEGTLEKPYEVSWEHLISASELYNPRNGKKRLPERVMMLDGKYVRMTGYVAFPMYVDKPKELLSMLNQWDGCCIGVPPTPYDAIEVRLKDVVQGGDRYATQGAVTGKFSVKPYLAGDWLVGLYVMDDAVFTTKSTAGATKN